MKVGIEAYHRPMPSKASRHGSCGRPDVTTASLARATTLTTTMMRGGMGVIAIALITFACGGKLSGGDLEGSSGSTSTSSSSSGSSGGSTGTVPTGTATPAPPKKPVQPPTSGEDAVYAAHASPGGYDHLEIYKADFANDRCIKIHLVSPSDLNPSGAFQYVSLPPQWSVQSSYRSPGAKNCEPGVPQKTIEVATDGKGSIDWKDDAKVFPCKVNVHVSIVFPKSPNIETLDATDVSVDGC